MICYFYAIFMPLNKKAPKRGKTPGIARTDPPYGRI
jgi:hypothetical protein